jgi:putative ABC transport system permease protein
MVRSATIRKLIFRDLKSSPGRFLAIFMMFALGAGFYAGLGSTAPSMRASADAYLHEERLSDFRLISTYGWSNEDVLAASKLPGVAAVMPRYSFVAKAESPSGTVGVLAVKTLPINTSENSQSYLNRLIVQEGRLPEKIGECVIDAESRVEIGARLKIIDEMEGADYDMLAAKELTVVGKVDSPEFISYARGNSTLGNGEVDTFIYLPAVGMNSPHYSEVCVLMEETADISAFSEAYKDLISESEGSLEAFTLSRAEERHGTIRSDAEKYLLDAEADIAEAEADLRDGQVEVDRGHADANREFASAKAELADGERKLAEGRADYERAAADIAAGEVALANARAQIDQMRALLATLPPGPQYNALAAQIAAADAQANQAAADIQAGKAQLDSARAEMDAAEAELQAGWARYERERGKAYAKLADAQAEIDDGWNDIASAKEDIAEARADLEEMDEPEAFVFERSDNPGYATFEPNTERIASLGATIPPFMYIIAALVCLTTMTRLVEEHRTRIGTLKALGYGRGAVISIYLFYAIVVSFAGSIAGMIAGVNLFPSRIWSAYEGMYNLGGFRLALEPITCVIALAAGVAVTATATLASCYDEQRSPAATLMRPRAPKAGKRVLLERVKVVWNHLNFNQKVTMRNIFRYKKRLVMTIVGIAGCCALLLASFGIEGSILSTADRQFNDIYHYDIYVLLKDDADHAEMERELGRFGSLEPITEISCTLVRGDANTDGFNTISAFAPKDPERLGEYISLYTSRGKPLSIEAAAPAGEAAIPRVILTDKLAKHMDVEVGETLTVRDGDGHGGEAVVSGITMNYVGGYVYMSDAAYRSIFGDAPKYNSMLIKLNESYADRDGGVSETVTEVMALDGVEFAYSSDILKDTVDDIAKNMDTVIFLVRLMSLLLAIVVLYNLININITEREREIATLKVLGYRPGEVFLYFFSESSILTFIGAVFGLPIGVVLHRRVISAIASEDASFPTHMEWFLYLLAPVLTMVICVVVNAMMQPKLKRIEPVSSLKSPE